MEDRYFIGWFTLSRNGSDAAQWRAALAGCGVEVNDEWAPVYCDKTPRKPRGASLALDMFPELSGAIRSMLAVVRPKKPVLVVPNMGHFGAENIWRLAWPLIAEKGGIVLSAEGREEIADLETGLHLFRQKRGRTATEKAMQARLKIGPPTIKMSPGKKEDAIRFFGDREWPIPRIATHCGCSVLTIRRRMKEWTGTDSKTEAVMLADEGKWPPKRKLR